jgi:RND family efflux transporter MFP subunit
MTTTLGSRRGFGKLHAVLILLVGILGGVAFLLAQGRRRAEAEEARARADEAARGQFVEVAEARRSPPQRKVTLSGEVHAFHESTLFAKVSGYLKLVRVDKGDHVADGEVLGVIEAPEVEQQIASKKADVAIKKLTDARYHGLATAGVVSQQDLDQAKAQVNIATADLAALNALRGYQVIRAPFAGIITARYADPGALLQAATSSQAALPLVRIADIDRVRVFVYLGQGDALRVHEGDPAEVWSDAHPEQHIQASVARFAKELDPRTRTMLTEIELDNRDAHLYPGAYMRVGLTLADIASIVVPADAIFFDAGKSKVALARDGKAHFVAVDMMETDGKNARLLPGTLDEGDRVILHPSDEVSDGAPVRVGSGRPLARH